MGAGKYLSKLKGQLNPSDAELTINDYLLQLILELMSNGVSPELSALRAKANTDGDTDAVAFFDRVLTKGPLLRDEVLTAEVTCTAAQIRSSFATPISVIAAPGAGLLIVPTGFYIAMDYNSIPYEAAVIDDSPTLFYTSPSGTALGGFASDKFAGSADAFQYALTGLGGLVYPEENAPLVFGMAAGAANNGNSPIYVKVWYKLLKKFLS